MCTPSRLVANNLLSNQFSLHLTSAPDCSPVVSLSQTYWLRRTEYAISIKRRNSCSRFEMTCEKRDMLCFLPIRKSAAHSNGCENKFNAKCLNFMLQWVSGSDWVRMDILCMLFMWMQKIKAVCQTVSKHGPVRRRLKSFGKSAQKKDANMLLSAMN